MDRVFIGVKSLKMNVIFVSKSYLRLVTAIYNRTYFVLRPRISIFAYQQNRFACKQVSLPKYFCQ
jgi:hypothetical protein